MVRCLSERWWSIYKTTSEMQLHATYFCVLLLWKRFPWINLLCHVKCSADLQTTIANSLSSLSVLNMRHLNRKEVQMFIQIIINRPKSSRTVVRISKPCGLYWAVEEETRSMTTLPVWGGWRTNRQGFWTSSTGIWTSLGRFAFSSLRTWG